MLTATKVRVSRKIGYNRPSIKAMVKKVNSVELPYCENVGICCYFFFMPNCRYGIKCYKNKASAIFCYVMQCFVAKYWKLAPQAFKLFSAISKDDQEVFCFGTETIPNIAMGISEENYALRLGHEQRYSYPEVISLAHNMRTYQRRGIHIILEDATHNRGNYGLNNDGEWNFIDFSESKMLYNDITMSRYNIERVPTFIELAQKNKILPKNFDIHEYWCQNG